MLEPVHTATPDTTKLSRLCRVRFDGVNWIPGNSRLSPTENMKSGHINNLVSYSQYYVTTASMYNQTSGDNTRFLRKIVFCEFASMSRL